MKILAVIPARGGSKRIPGKNIKSFCGKPILAHVLQAAEKSGVFDTIHVSTNDTEIAKTAEQHGYASQFMRPAELADDHTGILYPVRDAMREFEKQGQIFDAVALLFATSPLMSPSDLKNAAQEFQKGAQDQPLMAITEYPAPPEWAFTMGKNGALKPQQPGKFAMRSQDLEPAYYDAAMFTFLSRDFILHGDLDHIDRHYRGFLVTETRVTDIDTEDDWAAAEMKYKVLYGSSS